MRKSLLSRKDLRYAILKALIEYNYSLACTIAVIVFNAENEL